MNQKYAISLQMIYEEMVCPFSSVTNAKMVI